eukprot:1606674-Alexandrium_andersonii.AAC.1
MSAAIRRSRPPASARIPLCVLVDANARVGANPSAFVGEAQAEPENRNGRLFHQFLADHCLAALNTFREVDMP